MSDQDMVSATASFNGTAALDNPANMTVNADISMISVAGPDKLT